MAATNGAKKFLQQIIATLAEVGSYDRHLSKLRVVSGGSGRCVAEMKVEHEHCNRMGSLHGGCTATLVDTVSTMALMTTGQGVPGVSIDMSVSYMKAAKSGEEILINAETLKVGKTLAFLDVNITSKSTGTLVAKGSHTKYIG